MKRKRIIMLMLTWILLLSLSGCGNKEEGNPFDFSGIETKDLNPWNYMENMELSMSEPLKNLGASSAELGITIGIIGIVFSIFYMVLRICFSKSAAIKEEVKQEAVLKGMIAIMLFSIPFWLGLFKMTAELLV